MLNIRDSHSVTRARLGKQPKLSNRKLTIACLAVVAVCGILVCSKLLKPSQPSNTSFNSSLPDSTVPVLSETNTTQNRLRPLPKPLLQNISLVATVNKTREKEILLNGDWAPLLAKPITVRAVPTSEVSRLVTIGIKKFIGDAACLRLIRSIRQFYPDVRIVIADDGVPNERLHGLGAVDHFLMPFDSGLSAGRNLAVMQTETPYYMTCDDDFIFTNETRLEAVLSVLESSSYDLIGGVLWNKDGVLVDHEMIFWDEAPSAGRYTIHKCLELSYETVPVLGLPEPFQVQTTDSVLNFFVGRTSVLQRVLWDPFLKLAEHTEFFWRLKGSGRVGLMPQLAAAHPGRDPSDKYKRFRGRHHGGPSMNQNVFRKYMFKKWRVHPRDIVAYEVGTCPMDINR
eukprot:TRINITY_DN4624_c0_g1_i1.p1 TRINITY_DN4624_c0_g1~~TRINITY_DN4624_c0_g1_i1.p1  ORF type:complete len:398 (+),score=100.23 TRINITY_DN4624_c0_g1_i1:133-1326(+)